MFTAAAKSLNKSGQLVAQVRQVSPTTRAGTRDATSIDISFMVAGIVIRLGCDKSSNLVKSRRALNVDEEEIKFNQLRGRAHVLIIISKQRN